MRGLKRLNPLKDPSAPESLLMNEPVKRLTLVSDAWHPQVNGVVRTIENTNRELAKMGMSVTMITAVVFHLLNTGGEDFPLGIPKAHSYNFELAAMYVATLLFFTANGAGPFSVDEQVLGGELKFYKGVVDKVTGKGE